MKVALVVHDLSIHGGTQKQVLRLAEDLIRRNASIQILAFNYDREKGFREFGWLGIESLSPTNRKGWVSRALGSIVDALRVASMIGPDTEILNVHDLMCEWVVLFAKLRHPQMKVVWQINDLHPAFRVGPYRNLKPRWTHLVHRLTGRMAALLADKVTVNVRKNKERVDKCYKTDSLLFYPGVDQLDTEPRARSFKTQRALLSIGVFFPYRNYEVLLHAMALLRERAVGSSLTLVGATHASAAYANKIRELAAGLEVPVHIAGEVDDDEFKRIVGDADIFLFPNLDQSWGLAVFEAMSASLPSIISKSAGAAELLAGRPGCLVVDAESPDEIASAVMEITKTQQDYSQSCHDAFRTVSAMNWPAMYCRETWNLFNGLLASPSAAAVRLQD
jgi:glycosyltransferase involved in cell wall biosynthesis